MTIWTNAQQMAWKQALKQLIKSSGQTQVEVAKEMARLVSVSEGTTMVLTAFVAPLSRFVNAKGSEINRWFEQQDERLQPLAKALQLDSVESLKSIRERVLFGQSHQTIQHPAFPDIDWSFNWARCNLSAECYTGLDDFILGLLTRDGMIIPNHGPWWQGGRILQFPWSEIQTQLLNSPIPQSHQERIRGLSAEDWRPIRLPLYDALWWIHDILDADEIWNGASLVSGWYSVFQTIWHARQRRLLGQRIPSVLKLTDEQWSALMVDWWALMDPLGLTVEQWSALSCWSVIERAQTVPPSTNVLQGLRSNDKRIRLQAIQVVEDWCNPLTSISLLEDLIQQNIVTIQDERIYLQNPWSWLPILDVQKIKHAKRLCTSVCWYPLLSWSTLDHRMASLQFLLGAIPSSWSMDRSAAIIWSCATIEAARVHCTKTHASVDSMMFSQKALQNAWEQFLEHCQSGLVWGVGLSRVLDSQFTLTRLCTVFSERYCDVLGSFNASEKSEQGGLFRQTLEQYAPYQVPPTNEREWVARHARSPVPVWKILHRRAQCGDTSAALLLATTIFEGREIECQAPIDIRLAWIAKIPNSSNRFVLFRQLILEYWSSENPSLPLVLQIAEDIGFDTVLDWMGGWINPLFLVQSTSDAKTLARLAIDFAVHFQHQALLEAWLMDVWDWIRVKNSIEAGFAVWKGRRVLIHGDVESIYSEIASILSYGLQYALDSDLALVMAKATRALSAGDPLLKPCRTAKEHLLQQSHPDLCSVWLNSAPEVDLDVERISLQVPALLNTLWRMDARGQRRGDVLRLAALLQTIPMWAVREAEKVVRRSGHWPMWVSPFSKEVAHLLPHLMTSPQLIHRLWWARAYLNHSADLSLIWSMLHEAFQEDIFSWRIQTVHFLTFNQTPQMDLDDFLRWISTIQRQHSGPWNSQDGHKLVRLLQAFWQRHLTNFTEPQLFMILSILSKERPMTQLLTLSSIERLWGGLSDSGQRVILDNWLPHQTLADLIQLIDHPLVGETVLQNLSVERHPIVTEHILAQIGSGQVHALDAAFRYHIATPDIISAVETALSQSNATAAITRWIMENSARWLNRDVAWQVWVRQLLG